MNYSGEPKEKKVLATILPTKQAFYIIEFQPPYRIKDTRYFSFEW